MLLTLASSVEPIGTLWTNALRMTVIPLVVSHIAAAVVSTTKHNLGRLGGGLFLIFLGFLAVAAIFTVAVTPLLLDGFSINQSTTAFFQSSISNTPSAATEDLKNIATLKDWLVDLVPVNPVKAASDGAILPLIVFTILFALATTRTAAARRQLLEIFFRAVAEATRVLVRWILAFMPVGVFALAFPLATRAGPDAAGAVGFFIVLVSALLLAFTLALYPVGFLVGRVPLRRFAAALAPAQAVAVSTRSSLASLPALMEGAQERLGLSPSVSGFALPLAVSTFKISVVIANTVTFFFLAQLYHVNVGPLQVATFVVAIIILSFGAPGIPSLGVTALPAFIAVGIPIEGVLILHAVDVIPDIFKTLVNVTGDMTAATLVARIVGVPISPTSPPGSAVG